MNSQTIVTALIVIVILLALAGIVEAMWRARKDKRDKDDG